MSKLVAFVALAASAQQVASVAIWGQCGGQGYTGSTVCDPGSVCVKSNTFFSQCLPIGSTVSPVPTTSPSPTFSTMPTPAPTETGLNAKFTKYPGKKFWGVFTDPIYINVAANAAIVVDEFGAVTPTETMTWSETETLAQNVFTYGGSDALLNWSLSNGKMIRGQSLVWDSQLPSWVMSITDKNTLTSVIQNHIANVAGRYKGLLYSWDVVTEILNDDGTFASQFFYNVMGESFVSIAFTAARAADPTAKLYINDFGLDSNNAKVQGMLALVQRINANGQLIDGIGTEMHLSAGGTGGVQEALTALGTSGLEVAITELDIVGAAPDDYVTVAHACLAVPACVSITSSSVSDADSLQANSTGLLWDSNYKPKPAYTALMAAL